MRRAHVLALIALLVVLVTAAAGAIAASVRGGPGVEPGPCYRDALKQSEECLLFCKRSVPRARRNDCRLACTDHLVQHADFCGLN